MWRPFITLIFSLVFLCDLQSQDYKAFYVGHSLSDQIPDMVKSLAADHYSADFDWVYQSIPGAPLRWQWDRKDAMDYYPIDPHYYGFYDTDYGLPAGNYDILVLTESVPRYVDIIAETYQYADSFYRYAMQYNPDLRVYLYEDWHCVLSGTPTGCDYDVDSNPWRQRLADDLPMWESVVDTLNARFQPAIPVCMIPAGQGLAMLYDSIQAGVVPDLDSIQDIFSDNIHLTDVGKYFIACIHFATLYETSPVGLTNQLHYWWGGEFDPPSAALALKFQEIAWEAVLTYPNACLDPAFAVDVELHDDGITIHPNPSADIFEIEGLLGDFTIQILDATGNIYQTLNGTGQRIEIHVQTLPSGLYFVHIVHNNAANLATQLILKE